MLSDLRIAFFKFRNQSLIVFNLYVDISSCAFVIFKWLGNKQENNLYYLKNRLARITQQWQGINFESISDKYATSV